MHSIGRKSWNAALVLCLSCALTAQARSEEEGPPPNAVKAALKRITADSLRGHLAFIASDMLEGRDSPSRGLDIASEYIAAQFRRAKLEPIGDDGYFQSASLLETVPNPSGFSFLLSRTDGTVRIGPDQITMYSDAALKIDAAKLYKIDSDDSTAIASLTPGEIGGQVLVLERAHAHWADVLEKLYALKPALILRISREQGRSDGVATRRLIDADNPTDVAAPETTPVPLMEVVNPEVTALFDAASPGVTGTTVSLRVPAAAERPVKLRNVIGVLRGADPVLRDTYVFLTAHYDHLGTDRNGRIYNGANDNGSGTVTVMEVAAALASLPTRPKRSIVFMTVFGEEKRHVGSEYYTHHPLVPIGDTVADVNLEQMGRTDSPDGPKISSATLTGFDYTNMTDIFRRAGKLTGIRIYDDARQSAPAFRFSDNLSFAEQGVPAQTLGVLYQFPDFHDVGDKVEKVDYENMARVDRMLALGVLTIAESTIAPRWNETLDETAPFVQAWRSRAHR